MKTSTTIINNTTSTKSEDNYIYIYSPIYYSNCSAFYGTVCSKNLSSRNLINPRKFSFTPQSLSKIKKEQQEEMKNFQNEYYRGVLTEQNNYNNSIYKNYNNNNNVINIINSIIDPPLSERTRKNNNNIFTYKIKNKNKLFSEIDKKNQSNKSLNIVINKEKEDNNLKNNSMNFYDKKYKDSENNNNKFKNTIIKNIFGNFKNDGDKNNNNNNNNNINNKNNISIEIESYNNNTIEDNNNNEDNNNIEDNNNNIPKKEKEIKEFSKALKINKIV